MKYYSIIAFASAVVHSVLGILIGRGRLKGFVNIMCKTPNRFKFLGGYFIASGVIMLSCAVAALRESTGSIVYLAFSAGVISVILSLMRTENL